MSISPEAVVAAYAGDTNDDAVIAEQISPRHRDAIGKGVCKLLEVLDEIRLTELTIQQTKDEIYDLTARIKNFHYAECLGDGTNEPNDRQLDDYSVDILLSLSFKLDLLQEKLEDLRNRPQ